MRDHDITGILPRKVHQREQDENNLVLRLLGNCKFEAFAAENFLLRKFEARFKQYIWIDTIYFGEWEAHPLYQMLTDFSQNRFHAHIAVKLKFWQILIWFSWFDLLMKQIASDATCVFNCWSQNLFSLSLFWSNRDWWNVHHANIDLKATDQICDVCLFHSFLRNRFFLSTHSLHIWQVREHWLFFRLYTSSFSWVGLFWPHS